MNMKQLFTTAVLAVSLSLGLNTNVFAVDTLPTVTPACQKGDVRCLTTRIVKGGTFYDQLRETFSPSRVEQIGKNNGLSAEELHYQLPKGTFTFTL